MITEEMKGAMQGIVPSMIVTASRDGIPNINYVSQVYYVDDQHVAISHQFFNKSVRNFHDNPHACTCIVHPESGQTWRLHMVFSHSETEGNLFESMRAQLEGIASMMGLEDVFNLKAAEIFDVTSVEKLLMDPGISQ